MVGDSTGVLVSYRFRRGHFAVFPSSERLDTSLCGGLLSIGLLFRRARAGDRRQPSFRPPRIEVAAKKETETAGSEQHLEPQRKSPAAFLSTLLKVVGALLNAEIRCARLAKWDLRVQQRVPVMQCIRKSRMPS